MKKGLRITVIIGTFILALVIGVGVLLLIGTPGSSVILTQMERRYERKFQIVEEFTYITHADGEFNTWLERKAAELRCPAVILEDKENDNIRFLAYAYPLEGGEWIYRDNYSRQLLLYCIKQENLAVSNEDECKEVATFTNPCLVLENIEETAEKLQDMVVCFNELYPSNDKYDSQNGCFEVEGAPFVFQILAGNVSDRWLDETSPFCYDTPIEKYKAFLDKLEEGRQ